MNTWSTFGILVIIYFGIYNSEDSHTLKARKILKVLFKNYRSQSVSRIRAFKTSKSCKSCIVVSISNNNRINTIFNQFYNYMNIYSYIFIIILSKSYNYHKKWYNSDQNYVEDQN